jgi:hypothetical protein
MKVPYIGLVTQKKNTQQKYYLLCEFSTSKCATASTLLSKILMQLTHISSPKTQSVTGAEFIIDHCRKQACQWYILSFFHHVPEHGNSIA